MPVNLVSATLPWGLAFAYFLNWLGVFSFLDQQNYVCVVSSFLREVGTFVQMSSTGVAALIHLDHASVSNSNLKSHEKLSVNKSVKLLIHFPTLIR